MKRGTPMTNSNARKRLEGQHQAHPDPAVRELLAHAWDQGWASSTDFLSDTITGPEDNPYRSKPCGRIS